MFDGIKILDVSVDVDTLLANDHLTFAALVNGQTGVILDPTRKAFDRGLTFRLVPRRTRHGYRLEMKGSLHKFHNNGQYNADQFTVNDLLLTLDELVCSYGFDLFSSTINNIEFGVNVELPFSVSQVLKNLVCYKNQPFYLDTHSDTPYYVCQLQRYAVKIYDKGKQRNLNGNWLRFEIRVKKMEYFNGTTIKLLTLADLLNVGNYKQLGIILVNTFNEILFDDSTIDLAKLPLDKQEIYRNGRNPRYWHIPDDLTHKQANTHRQRLSRDRRRYRALFEQYGGKWQEETAALIGKTWNKLTAIDARLLTLTKDNRIKWQNLINPTVTVQPVDKSCHKLTDSSLLIRKNVKGTTCHELTDLITSNLSQINPLYSGLICDSNQPCKQGVESVKTTQKPGAVVCPITGFVIEYPRPRQRFVSATQLRNLYDLDRPTFDNVAARFLTTKQVGTSLEQQCYYMAHNIRNAYTNQFNNPLRIIKKYLHLEKRQMLLFSVSEHIKPTDRMQAGIDYRKGTRYEIDL
ncbi:hypothetical protein GCM10027592_05120 [Spirosoma flavus]